MNSTKLSSSLPCCTQHQRPENHVQEWWQIAAGYIARHVVLLWKKPHISTQIATQAQASIVALQWVMGCVHQLFWSMSGDEWSCLMLSLSPDGHAIVRLVNVVLMPVKLSMGPHSALLPPTLQRDCWPEGEHAACIFDRLWGREPFKRLNDTKLTSFVRVGKRVLNLPAPQTRASSGKHDLLITSIYLLETLWSWLGASVSKTDIFHPAPTALSAPMQVSWVFK